MASYRLTKYGWRAEIFRRGVRRSESGFKTKAAAVAWAGKQEAEIMAGVRGDIPNLTLSALFDRYINEVCPGKKGARWEVVRLEALKRDRIAQVRLRQLGTPHVSDWQQRRLKAISAASVRRERNLINNVFQIAVKEWHWLRKNPFEGVRRPKDGKARDRIATQDELDRLTERASPNMAKAIIAAVETGMRQGELANLNPEYINGRVAKLVDTKNGTSREVPLSEKALACFPVGLTADSISQLFRQLCKECGIEGLTFHDLRATAATRLSKKLNPMQLAKMLGHKNLKMLMVYYREDAQDIAKML